MGAVGLVGCVHLHGVVACLLSTLGALALLALEVILTLVLKIHTAILGHLVIVFFVILPVLLGTLDSGHLCVLAAVGLSLGALSLLGDLFLGFLSTVLISIGDQIGFRLLRWVLSRRRVLRVPIDSRVSVFFMLCAPGSSLLTT